MNIGLGKSATPARRVERAAKFYVALGGARAGQRGGEKHAPLPIRAFWAISVPAAGWRGDVSAEFVWY